MRLTKLTNYSVLQQFYSKSEEGRLNPHYPFFTLQWMNEPDQEEREAPYRDGTLSTLSLLNSARSS